MREAVHRALNGLEQDGAAKPEKARVLIPDIKALERRSESTTSPVS